MDLAEDDGMKTSNDIISFTLIDLLLQVCFIVLLLYVAAHTASDKESLSPQEKAPQLRKLLENAGVSNLTELTDELSALGPIKELKGTADFISRMGGEEKLTAVMNAIEQAGGINQLSTQLERLKKIDEGFGKPPCLFNAVAEKRIPRPLATVIATDTRITFTSETPALADVLKLLGQQYGTIREMPVSEFKKIFDPLLQRKPECRYTLRFIENTGLVHARDAAGSVFYLSIERRK
jgi:hypothetical protein